MRVRVGLFRWWVALRMVRQAPGGREDLGSYVSRSLPWVALNSGSMMMSAGVLL